MTALAWDTPGEKTYQTGVDRGVLFLQDGTGVAWNGLTGVEETPSEDTNDFYLDGVKYLEYVSPGDFSANLKAFTYPEEFDEVNGILRYTPGLRVHNQPPKTFSLSYRTMIGDDLSGVDSEYLIHILYNVIANPDSYESPTISDSPTPIEFSWVLSARPVTSGVAWRPTAHVSIDSRDAPSDLLTTFEETLYGTSEADPSLPAMSAIPSLLGYTP